MNKRKFILSVMMVTAVLLLVSCATTDNGPANPFTGKYKGTWVEEGKDSHGTWTFTIDKKGRLNGSFNSGSYGASCSGTLDDSGNITFTIPNFHVNATGTINSNSEVEGTWKSTKDNSHGTFTGAIR